MQEHLDQASHNQDFHDCIHANFSTKFFDWKITTLFYVALHCMKALAAKRRIVIGSTHQDIEKNVNPDRNDAKMRIARGAWKEYKSLYRYAHTARYEGIIDIATFDKLKEADYNYAIQHLENFKKYLRGQGLTV